MLQVPNYAIELVFMQYEGNVEIDGKIAYLPLCITMFLIKKPF